MKTLILGATGDQGFAQVDAALARGHEVLAGVRDPLRAAENLPVATGLRRVEFADADSLRAAMSGVDVVLANFPSSSFNPAAALIEAAVTVGRAARDSGVALIVFNTSMPLQRQPLGFAGHDVRLEMVERLAASRVPLITLNPVVFMGNLLRGWTFPGIAGRGVFAYPHDPQLEVCWICQQDLAQLMLAAAERPQLAGRRYAVGGPQALRGADVARILSEVMHRPIRFVSQPVEEFCNAIRPQLRIADAMERERMLAELAGIYRWYNESPVRPFKVDMQPVLADLPVALTTLRDWAAAQDWLAPKT